MENKHIVVALTIVLIAVLMVLFLFQSNRTPNFEGNSTIDFNTTNQQSIPQITQLQGQDLVVGTGSAVVAGDMIKVHYIGTFLDGKKFDSSYERGRPLEITVGARQVIAGFDQGVMDMKVGGKRKLIIPASLGYGEKGTGPIPPNTPIQFEIELLEIKAKESPTLSPGPSLTPAESPTSTP